MTYYYIQQGSQIDFRLPTPSAIDSQHVHDHEIDGKFDYEIDGMKIRLQNRFRLVFGCDFNFDC